MFKSLDSVELLLHSGCASNIVPHNQQYRVYSLSIRRMCKLPSSSTKSFVHEKEYVEITFQAFKKET